MRVRENPLKHFRNAAVKPWVLGKGKNRPTAEDKYRELLDVDLNERRKRLAKERIGERRRSRTNMDFDILSESVDRQARCRSPNLFIGILRMITVLVGIFQEGDEKSDLPVFQRVGETRVWGYGY